MAPICGYHPMAIENRSIQNSRAQSDTYSPPLSPLSPLLPLSDNPPPIISPIGSPVFRPHNITTLPPPMTTTTTSFFQPIARRITAHVNSNEIESDELMKKLTEAVDACCLTGDPQVLPKMVYAFMSAIEKNLHDHDSPLYGSGEAEVFGQWRAPRNARLDIGIQMRDVEGMINRPNSTRPVPDTRIADAYR